MSSYTSEVYTSVLPAILLRLAPHIFYIFLVVRSNPLTFWRTITEDSFLLLYFGHMSKVCLNKRGAPWQFNTFLILYIYAVVHPVTRFTCLRVLHRILTWGTTSLPCLSYLSPISCCLLFKVGIAHPRMLQYPQHLSCRCYLALCPSIWPSSRTSLLSIRPSRRFYFSSHHHWQISRSVYSPVDQFVCLSVRPLNKV